MTQVLNMADVPVAPPVAYVPSAAGASLPANNSEWLLTVDTVGAIPPGQPLIVAVEYQRDVWTDKAGVQHVAGEWLQDTILTTKTGSTEWMRSTIGAVDAMDRMVEPYPLRVRVRFDRAGEWSIPILVLMVR